jgi:hypothetical protein|nr:MAG TPA: hypothetical protein [Caudoviricetes sp.]
MSFGKKTSINKIKFNSVRGLRKEIFVKRDKRINFKELYQIRFLSDGIAITVKTTSAKTAKAIIQKNKDAVVHLHSDRTASQLFLEALLRQARGEEGVIG